MGSVVAGIAALGAASSLIPEETQKSLYKNAADSIESDPKLKRGTEILETAFDTTILTVLEAASVLLVNVNKAPIGSRVNEEDIRVVAHSNIPDIMSGAALPSIGLELVRWIPHVLLPNNLKNSLTTNLLQASVSAMIENQKYVEDQTTPGTGKRPHYFLNGKLPLYQLAEGMFYWDLLSKKGLPHSITSHLVNASLKLVVIKRLYKSNPTTAENVLAPITQADSVDWIKDHRMNSILYHLRQNREPTENH
jgi:hypothetical protein